MIDREKLPVQWKDGLTQGAASVVMDWNMKTSSVMDGLAQGTAGVMVNWNRETSCVMVYMCVLRGKEVFSFF